MISLSVLRSALHAADVNERAISPPDGGESGELNESDEEKGKTTLPIASTGDLVAYDVDPSEVELPKFAPDELIGLTFLRDTPDGQRVRAQVLQKVNDFESPNHKNLKFLLKLGDDDLEELIG